MQIGRLRHRVTIQNFTTTKLPSGQEKEEWVDGKSCWAEAKGISGREQIASGAERAEITHRVWVRYRTDITAASRLKVLNGPYRRAVLEVAGPPVPDTKGELMEVMCKSGVKP